MEYEIYLTDKQLKTIKRLYIPFIIGIVLLAASFQVKAETFRVMSPAQIAIRNAKFVYTHKISPATDDELRAYFVNKQEMTYLGNFRISHYSEHPDENGGWTIPEDNTVGITATCHRIVEGYTCAMLRGYLPYGTVIWIEELNDYRVVDDCGVGYGKVDVAVIGIDRAKVAGIYYSNVYVAGTIDDEQFGFLRERYGE